jgi:hypothetical protein
MAEELNPNEILSVEFEYISQSAFQANEDRAKVSTLYLLTVGSFLAAMMSVRSESLGSQTASFAFAGLFFILSVYAALSLVQLIRLRQAWHASAVAMDRIKNYYIRHSTSEGLEDAFEWKTTTLPRRFKPWSVSFLMALQIGMLGAAAIGASVIFVVLALTGSFEVWMWVIAILVAIIYFIDLMLIYWWLLRDTSEPDGS